MVGDIVMVLLATVPSFGLIGRFCACAGGEEGDRS